MSASRKLSLPKNVRIGAFNYRIEELDAVTATKENLYGDITYVDPRIRISEALKPAMRAETLLHEILHGAFSNGFLKEDNEEQIVCVLSVQLCQVIRDNPKVVDYIVKSIRSA